jgi:hypothetical protein
LSSKQSTIIGAKRSIPHSSGVAFARSFVRVTLFLPLFSQTIDLHRFIVVSFAQTTLKLWQKQLRQNSYGKCNSATTTPRIASAAPQSLRRRNR